MTQVHTINMDMPPPQYTVVKDTLEGSGSPDVNTSAIPTTSNGIEQDRPLNVLILGEMANGKSTLIRQLKVYAGSDNPDIGIGFGEEHQDCINRMHTNQL